MGEGHFIKHKQFFFLVNKKLGGGEAAPFQGQGMPHASTRIILPAKADC